jgi:hypothetical protein
MVAGNEDDPAQQKVSSVGWSCDANGSVREQTTIPDCRNDTDVLQVHLKFPSCWDGVNFDPTDFKSHLVYPRKQKDGTLACPQDDVPLLAILIKFRLLEPC